MQTNNDNFGISKALPELSDDEIKNVVTFMKNEMGVTDQNELLDLKESDFTDNEILKPIKARKLLKYFEKGE